MKTVVAKEFQVQVREEIPESPSAAFPSPPLADNQQGPKAAWTEASSSGS